LLAIPIVPVAEHCLIQQQETACPDIDLKQNRSKLQELGVQVIAEVLLKADSHVISGHKWPERALVFSHLAAL
jgi:hypothetical protein